MCRDADIPDHLDCIDTGADLPHRKKHTPLLQYHVMELVLVCSVGFRQDPVANAQVRYHQPKHAHQHRHAIDVRHVWDLL